VKFLLDVSALVSLAALDHEFHDRATRWIENLARGRKPDLATCSITELGFVRVMAQAPQYGLDVLQAKELLHRIKTVTDARFTFFADNNDVSHLPSWVRTAKQTTDGHLAELARSNGAVLATFDRNIRGAFLIPL